MKLQSENIPSIQTNCAGFSETTKSCRILTVLLCKERKCSFCKSEQQAEADRKASYERRKKLGGPFTEYDREYRREGKAYLLMKKVFICTSCISNMKHKNYIRWPYTSLKKDKCKMCGRLFYGYDHVKKDGNSKVLK